MPLKRRPTDALIIEHVPHETAGTILPALNSSGISGRSVKLWRGDRLPQNIDDSTLLVVMGGPMGVYEEDRYPFIKDELRLLERAWHRGVKTLGICLGAQLMARALGCRVYKGEAKEIGWYPIELTEEGRRDPLLLGFPERLTVFHWHGDTFELPRGARLLARSSLFENQLVRMGRNWYAVQFHLELTEKMILEWLSLEENLEELEEAGLDKNRIVEDTDLYGTRLKSYGNAFFTRFLRL